ncbi:MAG TPA: hypothetical protein VG165_16665 [Solirubrobacteraceae bacterium]|jgi:hypothetical protein|nr:hypothetical protein [Solirubrobacteraceae bacterium]
MRTYDILGLRIRSELSLTSPGLADADADAEVDVTVTVGPRAEVPWRRPSADVIAELVAPDGWPRYTFCGAPNGTTTARFYGLADFVIAADHGSAVCHEDPSAPPGFAAMLLEGSVAAYLLSVAGDCVLHASAVELAPGYAVAFIGPSARGKTTTAALLCAAGLPLLADDVLPVALDGPLPRCRRGAAELRLRPGQAYVARMFADTVETRTTADGRIAIRPTRSASREPVLAKIVLPRPRRDGEHVEARRLSLAESVQILASTTRIEGWRSAEQIARRFEHAVDIAASVPVFEVAIPWGPPFATSVVRDLIDQLSPTADLAVH